MALEAISMDQALDVWSDLLEAYRGVNGYGRHTCEIYLFRLCRNVPSEMLETAKRNPGGPIDQVVAEAYRDANLALAELVEKLCERHEDATATIKLCDAATTIRANTDNRWRWHITIERADQNPFPACP